ncbi:GNAT family N-acetyltransferase [Streptomyces sp. RFCAC02]|uniref:GNAT family N-acetyltransferase n=1 Tax=Streptomyces sp. RFCAC02 TaxID=2499143 RepID=UPI00101F50CB|nr:GNAT family N-acetyltransferase [Streptomyces sp. RFCAC02]
MLSDGWWFTEDIDDFLDRAGDFLRSRPALHNTPLTTIEKLRARADALGAGPTLFGRLAENGEVRAVCYRLPTRRLTVTSLSPERADALAARLTGLDHRLTGVVADEDTASAFAGAWQRCTGAAPAPFWRARLHRLGTLTPPVPFAGGRGRVAAEQDRERLVDWCRDFCVDVGEQGVVDAIAAGSWADTRFADKRFTFWECEDGTPVSMAGATPMVGGMVRVDPVYTPAHLRGRGYAGAVTVEVSRAALAAGATDVVLFTDPGNATSNALYRRIGYVPLGEFVGYAFSHDGPGAG